MVMEATPSRAPPMPPPDAWKSLQPSEFARRERSKLILDFEPPRDCVATSQQSAANERHARAKRVRCARPPASNPSKWRHTQCLPPALERGALSAPWLATPREKRLLCAG